MRATAAWSWRILVIALAAVAVGYVIVTFKTIVVALLVALLLAVLLDPVGRWLRRYLRFPARRPPPRRSCSPWPSSSG